MDRTDPVRKFVKLALLFCLLVPAVTLSAQQTGNGESLSGYYARAGNNASPAKTAGNNIYIKFFEDRWVGMLFIPYPYASEVENDVIDRVFKAVKKQAPRAAIVRGKYGLLSEAATAQIERYGYLPGSHHFRMRRDVTLHHQTRQRPSRIDQTRSDQRAHHQV